MLQNVVLCFECIKYAVKAQSACQKCKQVALKISRCYFSRSGKMHRQYGLGHLHTLFVKQLFNVTFLRQYIFFFFINCLANCFVLKFSLIIQNYFLQLQVVKVFRKTNLHQCVFSYGYDTALGRFIQAKILCLEKVVWKN